MNQYVYHFPVKTMFGSQTLKSRIRFCDSGVKTCLCILKRCPVSFTLIKSRRSELLLSRSVQGLSQALSSTGREQESFEDFIFVSELERDGSLFSTKACQRGAAVPAA